jgi:anti-anti-sigma factor
MPGTVDFETSESRLDGDVPMYSIRGELDLPACDQVKARLLELAGTDSALVLDLRRCSFIDSRGLELVTELHQVSSARDGARPMFALLVGKGQVRRMLDLTSLDEFVPVFEDPPSALAHLTA